METKKINPNWRASQMGSIKVGIVNPNVLRHYEDGYIGKVKIVFQSKAELDKAAEENGLEVKIINYANFDGIMEARYKFVPKKNDR